MRRRSALVPLLLALVVARSPGQEAEPDGTALPIPDLIERLRSEEAQDRIRAAQALRERGDESRPTLEAILVPDLVDREAAPAAAVDPEFRLEVLRALVGIASPESTPVFRRLLLDGDEAVLRLADVGLRMVHPHWPDLMPGREIDRTEILEAWDVVLDRPATLEGPSIRIDPEIHRRFPDQMRIAAKTRQAYGVRIEGPLARMMGAGESVEIVQSLECGIEEVLDLAADPPRIRQTFTRCVSEVAGPPQVAAGGLPDLTGRVVLVPLYGDDPTFDDGSAIDSAMDGRLHRGQAMITLFPPGDWALGQEMPLPEDRLEFLPSGFATSPSPGEVEVLDVHTRGTYLGVDEAGRPVLRFVHAVAQRTEQQGGVVLLQRSWLAGRLTLDPETGRIVSCWFAGPIDFHLDLGGLAPSELGEIRLPGWISSRYDVGEGSD